MVTWLQDNFAFKKIEEIIHIYKEILKKAYKLFQSELLVRLMSLEVKRNSRNYKDSRQIGIAFLQKQLRNSGKDKKTFG